jgi:glyoxylase-like metal-dependent hydrolase (beta-lactamase superfamily II)
MMELARQPGPVELTVVTAAEWQVDRAGLINLDHPRAKAAGLEDGKEPVVLRFYVLQHPKRGTFLVDSGVAAAFRSEETAPVSWLLANAMDLESLKIHTDTGQWLRDNGRIDGVFLTHIHLDHIMGIPDVPSIVPIYAGPGETEAHGFLNLFTRGSTDRMLDRAGPLREWGFQDDPSGRFAGVSDVFGDGTVFALHAPGHSPGSTAFLVRTPSGPHLLTGDVCHTSWGWQNEVEPGTFSHDQPQSVASLAALKRLERELPNLTVHLGHQDLHANGAALVGTTRQASAQPVPDSSPER